MLGLHCTRRFSLCSFIIIVIMITAACCFCRHSQGTRALLETVVREEVQQLTNVRIQSSAPVSGLILDHASRAVRGVQLAGGRTVAASFVVDVSGRSSKCAVWLAEQGGAAAHMA